MVQVEMQPKTTRHSYPKKKKTTWHLYIYISKAIGEWGIVKAFSG